MRKYALLIRVIPLFFCLGCGAENPKGATRSDIEKEMAEAGADLKKDLDGIRRDTLAVQGELEKEAIERRSEEKKPTPVAAKVEQAVSKQPPPTPAEKKDAVQNGKTLKEWIVLLKDEDDLTRMRAADAVVKFGPDARDAVPALLAILKNKDDLAFFPAMGAIGAIGPEAKDAAPLLVKLLDDKDARIVAMGTLG